MGEQLSRFSIEMNRRLKGIARSLRKKPTEAEYLLWTYLRAKRLGGLKFRRQQPIGPYVVDFVCFGKGVIVEVEGEHHDVRRSQDLRRDDFLTRQGFIVLRFWNRDVLRHTEDVLEAIWKSCLDPPAP